MTNYKQLCSELIDELEGWIAYGYEIDIDRAHALIDRARAELAKPEPERLTVKEISDLPHHWHNFIAEDENGEVQLDGRFSRADIQQLADSIPTFMRITAKPNVRGLLQNLIDVNTTNP